jgi:hypothetical protein
MLSKKFVLKMTSICSTITKYTYLFFLYCTTFPNDTFYELQFIYSLNI